MHLTLFPATGLAFVTSSLLNDNVYHETFSWVPDNRLAILGFS